jgi:integrase
MDNLASAGDQNTVRAVLDAYLQAVENNRKPGTMRLKVMAARLFCKHWGELPCAQIKPWHAEQIVAERRSERRVGNEVVGFQTVRWGDAQAAIFLSSLKAAFNWAAKRELVSRNPLAAVELPPKRTRARDRVLTPEEHAAVLRVLGKPRQAYIRRLIIALENTGARPGELTNATTVNWDDEKGAIVYHREGARRAGEFSHKTARKNKDRVIMFTGEALAMVRRLVIELKPGGLIFPNGRGGHYTDKNLASGFKSIRLRVGIRHFIPYVYRHTFATRWLTEGRSVDVLASLLGNSPEVIRHHYSHLLGQHEALRAHLESFKGT